uniref:Uncharacterized protein n=1 Tax=Brassica oleracea TaxID=3712 RepID=A0A3P6FGS4_BRAOL|nr:unnamed protein product [Brassica oleracea]
MQKRKIDKARRTLIVASSFGDREKRRFEVLQKGISPSPVSFWPGLCFFHCSQGTETQVEKVNNSCRTSILAKVAKYCPDEYTEVSEDPLFAQVVAIYVHKLQFSERAIHTFVCKQLLTAKRHELWFHYARRPLRFSMQEFYAITGFWSKLLRRQKNISVQQIRKVHVKLCNTWSRVDRLRLVYLCVIAGILMAKDEKVWIPHKYIKLVMDFEKMRKYLWGLHSFDMLIWLMEAVPDIGSLLGQKLRKGVTTMRFKNWKGSAKISYEDIITIESNFASTGDVFPCISTSGNFKDVITDAEFARPSEMKDERVDLIIDMHSEEDGSDEEADVETSDTEIEDEIESTRVSPTKKRKNRFRDTGAESRKKRLLCQRSTEKYRDLEEEMKSYIQSMFNSSFTALELEVREVIEDRFIKLEEKILSSQTQGGAPANTQTRGADPFWTPSAAIAPASVSARGPAPTPASTEAPASVSTSGLAPSRSEASAPYHNRASATVHTGGPANAAKTRSQTKDDVLDHVCNIIVRMDVFLWTQEHLQKTMGNLTQESNVDGFDPSQDKQSEGTSAFTTPMTSFRPEIFKTPFLIDSDDLEVRCKAKDYELIGPSTFDAELASRISGPNIWLKNFDMDAMMYLFREKTALRWWRPDRVAFLNCMFSNQITTAYGKFDGNRRGYKIDDNFLEYGRGELPYNGSTGSVWSVDVDRLYIPICVNQIHWISIYVNLVNRTVDVFDCGGKKNNRVVETFTVLIPRIVKAVQSPERKKDFNVKQYTVSYVPMRGLNMNAMIHTLNPKLTMIHTLNPKLVWIHIKNFNIDSVLGCSILAANIRVIEYNRLWFVPTRPTRKFLKPDPKPGSTHPQTRDFLFIFRRLLLLIFLESLIMGITTFGSSTAENRYRRFYRCQIAKDRKTENHLFKWIDEALIDEIRMVDAKHERVAQEITKFEERVMEKVKSEIVRVEAEMSEKLKEKVNLEIARVEQEMKQKLKITTVAIVVVGAIVGIWTSLTV